MGWPMDMKQKGCESIDCGPMLWFSTFTSPITLTLDFQGQILKMLYLRYGMKIDMGRKGCESIGCYTHFVTFTFDFNHDLDLGFSSQILKKSYLRNGMADWHGMKGIRVDRMLDPCCDFQCSPHPWPWPWIFKVNYWKNHISWMGWPIDKERKGCESIECWTHIVTLNFDLTHDLDLGFARPICEIAVSQDWEARLTWNERDVNWIWCWMHNGIDLGPIHRPINGSIWNSYSFQPVGQLMGYSFTDLGAEGCCRSLNALSWLGLSMIQASYSNCSAHMHMYFKKKTQVL